MSQRAIVCGGRYYSDSAKIDAALSALALCGIAHGDAGGADALADRWARESGVPITTFPADWNALGRAAGPIRNQRMLDEFRPDLVVAFPGGRGTYDMVTRARSAGVLVMEVS